MGSQQGSQSVGRQNDKHVPLAPSGEEPRSHDSTRYHGPLTDQLLANTDRQLYDVSAVIGNARKILYDYSAALTTSYSKCSGYEQAYREERKLRIDESRTYTDLFNRHQTTVNDLHAMTYKCLALQHQLEGKGQARDASSSMAQEKEPFSDAKATRATGKGHEVSQSGFDMAEPGIGNEQLKVKIRELEQENAGKSQDYEKADKVEKMCQPASAEQIPAAKRVRKTKQK